MPRLCCVLTTFERPAAVLSRLREIQELSRLSPDWSIRVVVADDANEASLRARITSDHWDPLQVLYLGRVSRLGQGENAIDALAREVDYDYAWLPGDDDCLDASCLSEFLNTLSDSAPTCAVFGFKQGKSRPGGTALGTTVQLIENLDSGLSAITNFGKCTNLIISRPSENELALVRSAFSGSMFQDRALGALRLIASSTPSVLVYPRVCAVGSDDYGRLRYSQRVFVNLGRTISLAKAFNHPWVADDHTLDGLRLSRVDEVEVWKLWARGIKDSLTPRSEITYSRSIFWLEVLWPIRRLAMLVRGRRPFFERT